MHSSEEEAPVAARFEPAPLGPETDALEMSYWAIDKI